MGKKTNYKLSIIIPCYNVEKYIKRCMNSLIDSEFEIILVDDGSTDNTYNLCDFYNEFKNIKVFHKENGGLSDARNYGLNKASGEYIMFLDSDDYIELKIISKLILLFDSLKADMICCDFYKKNLSNNKIYLIESKLKEGYYTGSELMINLLLNKKYYPMVWKNIYKKSFLLKHNLFFKKGFLHEDEDWFPRALIASKTVYFYPDAFYYYCINSDSITHKKNDKNYLDLMSIAVDLKENLSISNIDNYKILHDHFTNLYLTSYALCSKKTNFSINFKDIYSLKLKVKYLLIRYMRGIMRIIYLKLK